MKTWVASLQSKFEGDPTVNESEIMVLPTQILGQCWNHTVLTQINQTPHSLTSTPSSCIRIIHTSDIEVGHLVSSRGIEVYKAKIDVITSLPYPTSMREMCFSLGHAGFYRRIQDFSKIALPLSELLQNDVDFVLD